MVKCSECGYLAVRQSFDRNLVEAEAAIRNGERWPIQQGTDYLMYETRPLCFVMAKNIGTKEGVYSVRDFTDAINTAHECPRFVNWQQGFTPKEHMEMENERRKLEQEERRRKSDIRWHIIEIVITLGVGSTIALIAAYIKG